MGKRCGKAGVPVKPGGPCSPPATAREGPGSFAQRRACDVLEWFSNMIDNCLAYATAAKQAGRPVVGIMCEYTPRELILAAGGVPVCLCGGDADMIGPAEEILPANLCPLIKSTFGYHVEKSNPFLEMADLLVAETTCDGKKKMYELLAESRPMYVLELPQKQDDPDAMEHWRREMRKLKAELERRFHTGITDKRLRSAIELMNRERSLRRQLAELMAADDPPLTGLELLRLKSSISGIPGDLRMYQTALDRLGPTPERPAEDSGGARSATERPVRVLMTGVPIVHGAERVLEIVESVGGLVVCMENCTGVKPLLEDVDEKAADPLSAVAEKYFHLPCSVQTVNQRRLDVMADLAARYRPQCVIELIWQACLTYDVEAARIKRFFTEQMHLPYLRISTDYSPSDSARIATRVQALFETVRRPAGKST
jgi:benzoyl-CoA reductase/2-hydroxyglutaryl-CoA dehydratase subunit BcrC/BadD/HgdB